jgi:hypothetical protein
MGWKTRKERLQGDQSGENNEIVADTVAPATNPQPAPRPVPETPQPAYAFGPTSAAQPAHTGEENGASEPDAITLARLRDPEFGGSDERAPFVLDLDNDIFRTDSRRTSLGQGGGSSWPNQAPQPISEPSARPPIVLGDDPPLFGGKAPQAPAGDFEDVSTPPFGVQTPYSHQPSNGGQAFQAPIWDPAPATSNWDPTPATPEQVWSAPEPAESPDSNWDPNGPKKVPSISELMAPREHEAPAPADIPAYEPPPMPVQPSLPPLPESYHRVPAPETSVRELPPNLNPFDVSRQREDVASGLVLEQSTAGIPKVSPFIVDVGNTPQIAEPVGEPTLLIRFKNLSATYAIKKDLVAIGRPDSETQNYPDVEIEMDEGVSRKHAEIRHKNGSYYVVDLGSTNGSLHNGERLIPNAETKLAHGDRIRVGEVTEIIFE